MNATAAAMSAASFLVVMGTWISYFAKIPAGRVAVRPIGSAILQWVGIALAVAAAGTYLAL